MNGGKKSFRSYSGLIPCNEQTKSSLQCNDATKYVQNIATQLTVHVNGELCAFVFMCMGNNFKLL